MMTNTREASVMFGECRKSSSSHVQPECVRLWELIYLEMITIKYLITQTNVELWMWGGDMERGERGTMMFRNGWSRLLVISLSLSLSLSLLRFLFNAVACRLNSLPPIKAVNPIPVQDAPCTIEGISHFFPRSQNSNFQCHELLDEGWLPQRRRHICPYNR